MWLDNRLEATEAYFFDDLVADVAFESNLDNVRDCHFG